MKLTFLFAALAFAQITDAPKPEQCVDQKQEVVRLQKLLSWYQQQYFTMQAKMIEQQIAPPAKQGDK